MRDVAIVSFAQSLPSGAVEDTETQMLYPVVNEAIERSGLTRSDIGFTCSGSADYLCGPPFAFVSTLEATGAWPPIEESHVEMDGAWALYEAWVRLQHGDLDAALVFSSGISTRAVSLRTVLSLQTDPYYLSPLCADPTSMAALQARAFLDASGRTEDALLDEPYVVAPLRAADGPPISDGAAACVLVAGDRAREVCERPAWIRGLDHRVDPHYPGVRGLSTSNSARLAAEHAGVGSAPIEVAELHASYSHEELLLCDAMGLGGDVEVNPSGGALRANPMMVSGLIRIGEAFRQINELGRHRTLGHAASGPCLQQNLVCVLEGEN